MSRIHDETQTRARNRLFLRTIRWATTQLARVPGCELKHLNMQSIDEE